MNELIRKGALVDAQDDKEKTPLHWASEANKTEAMDVLLINKAGINKKNNDGKTPLVIAIDEKNTEAVMLLLEKKADYSVADNKGQTPLHSAASQGNTEIMGKLVELKADVNIRDKNGNTPLHMATEKNKAEAVEFLLAKDADKKIKNNQGLTPLEYGKIRNKSLPVFDVLKLLDPQAKLYETIKNGDADKVSRLIQEESLDVNDPFVSSVYSSFGWHPLYLASALGKKEVVEVLLDAGAEVDQLNRTIGYLEETALHKAASNGHAETVNIFLARKDVDLDMKDNNRRTPLHAACRAGKIDIAKALVDAGANIDEHKDQAEGALDKTPLHLASQKGHVETVAFLLEAGADPTIETTDGRTAFDLAKAKNKVEVVELLQKAMEARTEKEGSQAEGPQSPRIPEGVTVSPEGQAREVRGGEVPEVGEEREGQEAEVRVEDIPSTPFTTMFIHSLAPLKGKKTITLEIDPQKIKTIYDLKKLIKEQTGVEIDSQRLISAGNKLENDETLASHRLTKESKIQLTVRSSGPIPEPEITKPAVTSISTEMGPGERSSFYQKHSFEVKASGAAVVLGIIASLGWPKFKKMLKKRGFWWKQEEELTSEEEVEKPETKPEDLSTEGLFVQ